MFLKPISSVCWLSQRGYRYTKLKLNLCDIVKIFIWKWGKFFGIWQHYLLSIEGLTFKTADRHGRNTDVGFSCLKTLSNFWIFFFFYFLFVHFLFLSLSFRTYTSRDFFFLYFIFFILRNAPISNFLLSIVVLPLVTRKRVGGVDAMISRWIEIEN